MSLFKSGLLRNFKTRYALGTNVQLVDTNEF